jgi:glutamate 5-kinase
MADNVNAPSNASKPMIRSMRSIDRSYSGRDGSDGGRPERARTRSAIRTLIVKIGSAAIAPDGALEPARVSVLAEQIASVVRSGVRVVVVSSGAVASGYAALGLGKPPKAIAQKQAAAAVGQPLLMRAWIDALGRHGLAAAQALYTAEDLDARARYLNTRRTLMELLDRGAVPIVNENDTTSFAEIKLGDNDRLSALTVGLIGADLLVILSQARGLYAQGNAGAIIPEIRPQDAGVHVQAGTSGVGTGGFVTKLEAARLCAGWGVVTIVAGADEPSVLTRVLAGERIGTRFVPDGPRGGTRARGARRRWLASSVRPRGVLVIDDGAVRALTQRGASLLPGGIVSVKGDFERDDAVEIRSSDGAVIARGLASYDAEEVRQIAGKAARQIEATLGYTYSDEVVHRDNLALIAGG